MRAAEAQKNLRISSESLLFDNAFSTIIPCAGLFSFRNLNVIDETVLRFTSVVTQLDIKLFKPALVLSYLP